MDPEPPRHRSPILNELERSGASVSNNAGGDSVSVSQVHPLQSMVPVMYQPGNAEYVPPEVFLHMTHYMSHV